MTDSLIRTGGYDGYIPDELSMPPQYEYTEAGLPRRRPGADLAKQLLLTGLLAEKPPAWPKDDPDRPRRYLPPTEANLNRVLDSIRRI